MHPPLVRHLVQRYSMQQPQLVAPHQGTVDRLFRLARRARLPVPHAHVLARSREGREARR